MSRSADYWVGVYDKTFNGESAFAARDPLKPNAFRDGPPTHVEHARYGHVRAARFKLDRRPYYEWTCHGASPVVGGGYTHGRGPK